VRVEEHKAPSYDFAAHWKSFEQRVTAKSFEHLEEIPGAGGEGNEPNMRASFRSYQGIARRTKTLRPYVLVAVTAHHTQPGRVYSIVVSLERDESQRNEGLAQAIIQSFQPFDPAAPQAVAPAKSPAPAPAGRK